MSVQLRVIDSLLPSSEYSISFLQAMLDRMAVSYAKYGKIIDAYPYKVDAIASMKQRISKYEETGNVEWLVDAANFLMIEFILPSHENPHYRPTSNTESPGRIWKDGEISSRKNI